MSTVLVAKLHVFVVRFGGGECHAQKYTVVILLPQNITEASSTIERERSFVRQRSLHEAPCATIIIWKRPER